MELFKYASSSCFASDAAELALPVLEPAPYFMPSWIAAWTGSNSLADKRVRFIRNILAEAVAGSAKALLGGGAMVSMKGSRAMAEVAEARESSDSRRVVVEDFMMASCAELED